MKEAYTMQDLSDKVIVITGASTGLGKALAMRLAEEDPRLVLHARTAEKLQEIQEQIQAKGGRVSTFSCDVTDINQTKHVVDYIAEAYDGVDILVNRFNEFAGLPCCGEYSNRPCVLAESNPGESL